MMSVSSKRRSSRPNIVSLFADTLQKNLRLLRNSESSGGSTHSLDRLGRTFWESDDDPNTSTIPHEGFARNEDWVGVQKAIMSIFHGRKLSSIERSRLYECVKQLSQSELGPFIYDYYRNQMMPRGMRILRQDVKLNHEGQMKGLDEVWNTFYKEILSDLKVALHPITIKEHNIRQLTLLGFRDFVLLKTNIEETFKATLDLDISPAIQQMLLVLQSVRISDPPSENYIRLERLVGRAVKPYLGYLGLYEGSSEPSILSMNSGSVLQRSKKVADELSRAPSLYQKRRPRHNTGLTGLETVSEMKSTKVLTFETVSAMTQREHSKLSKKLVTATQADSPPSALKVYNLGRRGRRHSCDILM